MGLELDGADPDDLDLSSIDVLEIVVELATKYHCRIKVADIEVEPLSPIAMPLVDLAAPVGDVPSEEEEDPRYAHTALKPPNLRELRGKGVQ